MVTIALVFSVSGGFCIYKIYRHELGQNEQIQELSSEVTLLKSKAETVNVKWNDEGYNYLAIGNSITRHGYADYWWDDDRGMAASEDSKDYVHLIEAYLKENGKNVTMNTENLAAWETNGNDRAEFLELADPYLYEGLDLVTIQLGENASNLDTWEKDFEELISHVKEKCPTAQIIIVGDFWSNGNRDSDKETAAKAQNVTYISLDGIKENEEYYAGLGTKVEGKDGKTHVIEHDGVAKHPGDKGMAAIAERIKVKIDLSK